MNLYLDTSALAKRYVEEPGSEDVLNWMELADMIGTGLVTRAETAAGMTHLLNRGILTEEDFRLALEQFRVDWIDYHRIPVNEELIARTDFLACQYSLRGYDAVHLASALVWQEALMVPVTLATYDQELAEACKKSGLRVLPEVN